MNFIKKQEARTHKSNSFVRSFVKFLLFWKYKMNKIINKFLLAADKFMAEMHLRKPGLAYSACGSFATNKDKTKIYLSKWTR